jgi:hypothetical protein
MQETRIVIQANQMIAPLLCIKATRRAMMIMRVKKIRQERGISPAVGHLLYAIHLAAGFRISDPGSCRICRDSQERLFDA